MDRPLHVQVAEAIGWTDVKEGLRALPDMEPLWLGKPPEWDADRHGYIANIEHSTRTVTMGMGSVPRYDTDWAATGPLIEKYGISMLGYNGKNLTIWEAQFVGSVEHHTDALGAVCKLIIRLASEGKLPK